MIRKGFDWFRVHIPFVKSRAIDTMIEPMACEVCKGCFHPVGKHLCKYSQALYIEVRSEQLNIKLY